MNEKVYSGKCLLLQLCLLVMSTSCLSATEMTDQPNCPRGNYTLKATNIVCIKYHKYTFCEWSLGTQHGNNSAIDTSCNYISNDESVEMFFALHDPLRQKGDIPWAPCPRQDHNLCILFPTPVTDPMHVMVKINNNRLNSCTGITTEQVQLMNVATYTADELQEIGLSAELYKQMSFQIHTHDAIDDEANMNSFTVVYLIITVVVSVFVVCVLTIAHIYIKIAQRSRELKYIKRGPIGSYSNFRLLENHTSERGISTVDEATWTYCINLQSEKLASELLRDNVLPTNAELQSICFKFGKRSKTLEDVCAKVCKTIVTVLKLKTSTNVWPACSLSNNKIVFVVESEMEWLNTRVSGFEIHVINSDNTLEKESQIVMLREKEILALCYDNFGVEKFQKLQQVISKSAKRLTDKHQSITVITPGVAKSIGYLTSGQHKLIESPCISIYVNKKVRNFIPLGEEPIPSIIDDFPIDVLEGKFEFFSNGPNDYHQHLKIGCGIHAGVRTIDGDTLGGTLGAFVKHHSFGLCCITSAHVVLSREELQCSKRYGYKEFANREERKAFQPASELSEEFGKLVAVSYKEGSCGSPGVEAALIKVQRRKPISGAFPHVASGSDQVEHFVYDSGNVIDASMLQLSTEVYKFGMATGPTTGYLGLQCAAVRVGSGRLDDPNIGVRLYNQLEIVPKHSSFAENGDSGALVFVGHPKSPAAIGILEGGLPNGRILVSPIIHVLDTLKCPCYLHRFEQDSDSWINVDLPVGAEGGNIEEDMELNKRY